MIKKLRYISAIILTMFSAVSCIMDHYDEEEPDNTGKVDLVLTIYSQASAFDTSRADFNNVSYEEAATQYERMRTLRVFIVRPNGIIEHNAYLEKTVAEEGLNVYSKLHLLVVPNETKQIFLFANEAFVEEENVFDFSTLEEGDVFPMEEVRNLVLKTSAPGQPLIDNTNLSEEHVGRFIPMSEEFAVDVKPTTNATVIDQEVFLFITRAAVKFTFHASSAATPRTAYRISELEVAWLGNKEYLLPKETEYNPPKSFLIDDRYIYDFEAPSDVTVDKYTFYPDNLQFDKSYTAGADLVYAPAIYFPETLLGSDKKFELSVKVSIDGAQGDTIHTVSVPLENLPILPRNTDVKIDLLFDTTDFKCRIDLVPYAAVDLNPKFGFDSLLQRQPVIGDTPPWTTIPGPDDPEPES